MPARARRRADRCPSARGVGGIARCVMAISSVRPDGGPAVQVELRGARGYAFDMNQSCAGRKMEHRPHGATPMIYRLLAAAVLLLHLGFILFVMAGAALVVRRRR